ncbi:MAG: hypothetical protein H5U08_19215 [Thermogutta sp.]|nr:hypothetical protein [Thermogutta sp.]
MRWPGEFGFRCTGRPEKAKAAASLGMLGWAAVVPELAAETPESLLRAAREVWTGWAQR